LGSQLEDSFSQADEHRKTPFWKVKPVKPPLTVSLSFARDNVLYHFTIRHVLFLTCTSDIKSGTQMADVTGSILNQRPPVYSIDGSLREVQTPPGPLPYRSRLAEVNGEALSVISLILFSIWHVGRDIHQSRNRWIRPGLSNYGSSVAMTAQNALPILFL
jgi:hypothetical protein